MSEVHKGHKKPKNAYKFLFGARNIAKRKEVRIKISKSKLGKRNPMWNGGKTKIQGYIKIKDMFSHLADGKGYVLEHRKIMENYLGRRLAKNEVVHHINEIRDDNRIENLRLFNNKGEHTAYHKLKGRVMLL